MQMDPTQKMDPTPNEPSQSSTTQQTTQTMTTSISTSGDPNEVMITPTKLHFKTSDTIAKIQIHNNTDRVLALKMKCSDNEVYKFKPVFFCLKPMVEFLVYIFFEF